MAALPSIRPTLGQYASPVWRGASCGTVVPPNLKRLLSVSPIPWAAAGPASARPAAPKTAGRRRCRVVLKTIMSPPPLRAARPLHRLRQAVEPGPEAVQRDRHADAFLRRLEHDEGCGLPA